MSVFSSIGHVFTSLFGAKASVAQKVLHEVSSFVQLASPIVAEIETELKASASPDAAKILVYVQRYEKDSVVAKSFVDSLTGLPVSVIWHNVAVFALASLVPAGTASSLLNLAIEMAYSIFKASPAATPQPAA